MHSCVIGTQSRSQVDKTKHCVLLLNKADLLSPDQRAAWSTWLTERKISFVYFSANAALEEEVHLPGCSVLLYSHQHALQEGVAAVEVGPYSVEGDVLGRVQLLDVFEKMGRGLCKVSQRQRRGCSFHSVVTRCLLLNPS